MDKPATLTLVMSVGGHGESNEPVAAYTDPTQAQRAVDDFNRQEGIYMWECGWQYTKEVPLMTTELDWGQRHE